MPAHSGLVPRAMEVKDRVNEKTIFFGWYIGSNLGIGVICGWNLLLVPILHRKFSCELPVFRTRSIGN